MKIREYLLIISILFSATSANAEVKRLDDIMAKATPEEKNDLGNLLKQIRIVPAKDPSTGQSVFRVVAVEKGSVYDREGVKAGDLVAAGSLGANGSMDLKASQKTVNKQEPERH
jgi:hypothetical protein